MRFQELLDRLRKQNDKLDLQFGEILETDEEECGILEKTVDGWADYFIERRNDAKTKAEASKELATRYAARAKMFEKDMNWRNEGLLVLVKMAGKTIKTVSGTVFSRQSKDTLEIIGEVPDEFKKTESKVVIETTIDKAAIETYLRSLPETERPSWAKIVPGKESIGIR